MSLFEAYFQNKNEFQNMNPGLDKIDKALGEAKFNPDNLGEVIHVAGTNGKGSTSFFIAQMLQKNNLKTALFTSPHIINIKERFSANLQQISADEFDNMFKKYEGIITKHNLTFFEATFLIAAMWFSEMKPHVTILETGLGGRWDATNTKLIQNKICVITSIAHDHAQILGNNILQIAEEKIRITRDKATLFLAENTKIVKKFIKTELNDKVIEVTTSKFARDNYPHPYCQNYSTALAVAKFITKDNNLEFAGLKLPPCRSEKVGKFIFDGSHNAAGVIALLKSECAKDAQTIIFTSTNDRNPKKILEILKKITTNIIFTTLPNNPRMFNEKPDGLDCKTILNPDDAFNEAVQSHKTVLITGSFFLCGYFKQKLTTEKEASC